MQAQVTVLRVDKFISKKGNPCLWVHFAEEGSLPARLLVYEKDQVEHFPPVGSKITLYNDFDNSMVAQLKFRW